jgi:hypothetical protein
LFCLLGFLVGFISSSMFNDFFRGGGHHGVDALRGSIDGGERVSVCGDVVMTDANSVIYATGICFCLCG